MELAKANIANLNNLKFLFYSRMVIVKRSFTYLSPLIISFLAFAFHAQALRFNNQENKQVKLRLQRPTAM